MLRSSTVSLSGSLVGSELPEENKEFYVVSLLVILEVATIQIM